MVQILWKSNAPHARSKDHELVELRLVDLGNTEERRYLVREIHASWSASAQQIEWKGYEDETYGTPLEANRRFESRKAKIVDAGFPYATVLS